MDYLEIVKRSWKLFKKNPVLWVYGAIIVAFGGTAVNLSGNYSNFSRLFDTSKPSLIDNDKIVSSLSGIGNELVKILSSIPVSFWLALSLGILFLLLFGLVLRAFIFNFSKTAFLKLADQAEKGEAITLGIGADYGLKFWLRSFLLNLVIGLIALTIIMVVILPIGLLALIPVIGWIILIILSLPLAIILFGFVIFISLWRSFGDLVICLEDYPLKQALSFSFKLTKKFFWQGIVLSLVNLVMGCLSGCLSMTVILLLGLLFLFSLLIGKLVGVLFTVVIGLILLVLVLAISFILTIVIDSLKTINWVLFYNELKKSEKYKNLIV